MAGLGDDLVGAIVAAVDHDQRAHRQARHLGRDLLQDVADVVRLEVGGDDDEDRPEDGVGVTAAEVLLAEFHHQADELTVAAAPACPRQLDRRSQRAEAHKLFACPNTARTLNSKCDSGLVG